MTPYEVTTCDRHNDFLKFCTELVNLLTVQTHPDCNKTATKQATLPVLG